MQQLDQIKDRLSEQTACRRVLKRLEYWIEMATIADVKDKKNIEEKEDFGTNRRAQRL